MPCNTLCGGFGPRGVRFPPEDWQRAAPREPERWSSWGFADSSPRGTRDDSTAGKSKLLVLFGRSSHDQISTRISSRALPRNPTGDDGSSQHDPACGFAPQLPHIGADPAVPQTPGVIFHPHDTAEYKLCCLPGNVQGITRCALYPWRR